MKFLVFLIVLVLCSTIAQGWQLKKCTMDKFAEINSGCSGSHVAFCDHVTDIEVDTAGLPSDIQNLCITMENDKPHLSLVSGSFSRFTSLEYLEIFGCFSRIHPGAFRGLSNLRRLNLYAEKCCEITMSRQVFKDLPQLKELNIDSLNFSMVATNVFYDLSQIEIISFDNLCTSYFSELICRIKHLTSLKEFVYRTDMVEILEYPNCTHKNESVFPRISRVKLFFSRIKDFHQGALDFFQDLLNLKFGYNDKLLNYLPRSGIKTVDALNYNTDTLFVGEVCVVVSKFSTKNLTLYFQTVSNVSQFKNDDCVGLEQLILHAFGTQPIDLSFIYFMTNLATLEFDGKGLSTSHFRSICASSVKVTWLTALTVRSSSISKLFSHQFSCLVKLEKLNITCCSVSEIEPFAFVGLISLRFLNLQNNNISVISAHVFDGLHSLLVLDLKDNPLYQTEEMAFGHLINLQQLYCSHYKSSPLGFVMRWNLTHIFGNIPEQLAYLFYEYIVPMELIIGSNITLKQNLTLHVRSITLNIEDCERPFFKSVTTLFARTKDILCGSEFIGKYIKHVENFMYISYFSDTIGDLTSLNELVHLKALRLDDMDLSKHSNVAVMFHNLTKLEKLQLFYCRFFSIDGTLTKDLYSLTFLQLIFRDYVTVYSSFLEPLTSLQNLGIYHLQLFCNCDNAEFSEWVKENKNVQVVIGNPGLDGLQCLSKNGFDRPNLQVYGKQNCFFEMGFVLFVLTSLGVILFMLVVLIHRIAVYYIFSLYYIARAWLEQAVRKDRRVQYHYDAFVSYSSKDENWVVNELLPSLEQRGPPFLRLCLHSRDFQLGKDVMDNITDSLYQSRYTLCLVSRNYLHSNWCSLEMRLATCRLQVEHKDVLILVFLEKIPLRLLSAHHRLARLVKTRTYLDWPQDPDHQNAFWDRLWDKLKPEAVL